MANFFSDVVQQFKSLAQLPAQAIKTKEAQDTQKKVEKQAYQATLPKTNFFADLIPLASRAGSTLAVAPQKSEPFKIEIKDTSKLFDKTRVVNDLRTAGTPNPEEVAATPLKPIASADPVGDVVRSAKKAIFETPARAAASLILETRNEDQFQPSSQAERFVLGDEPVKSLTLRTQEATPTAEKIVDKRFAPLAAYGAIAGLTALDLFSSGAPEDRNAIKLIVKSKDSEFIANILRSVNISEDLIPAASKKLAGISTEKEVTQALKKINITQTTTRLTESSVKDFNPDEYVQELMQKRQTAAEGEKLSIGQKAKNFLGELKAKLVDSNAPIEDTLAAAQREHKFSVLPEADITNQIDRTLRAPTLAGQFARDNGLEEVIKSVDNLDNLDQYLIAKQAKAVAERGIETGRDLARDHQLIDAFAPHYEPYAQKVSEYSHKLLDYSVDSGLISKELADELKVRYPDYVPLNRVFSELEKEGVVQGNTKAVASLSSQSVIQRLEGSERQIESPLESLLGKTNDAFVQGEKNKAARILAGYEKLPGNPFQLRELASGESAKHTVSFLDNGVKRTFETTPEIAAAAKALNVQQLNILGKILAFPVRLAKLGITGINLPFVASNIAKDQVTALVNSEKTVANPGVFLKALFSAVKHDDLYEEMVRAGAGGTSFDIARNQTPATIEKIRAGRSIPSKIKYTITHPSELLRAVEDIVGRSEELTRLQQFQGTKEAVLKEGYNATEAEIKAANAARQNTVNFARRGEWGSVLNSAFLYLNANIQGTRTFVRNLVERPLQTGTKLAIAVFTPVAVATAWNLSDPERKKAYDDISEFEKQNNIIIVPPHPTQDDKGRWNVIKIPLSQEVNSVTSLVRRPIEQAFGLDPVSMGEIANALIGSVSPVAPNANSVLSTLTPQAIKPEIEAYTNKNFFTGLPQVPDSMKNLSPELQARPNTSGTSRKIAGVIDVSPIKVENFVREAFGGVGSQALNLSDRVLAGLDIIPKNQIGGQNVIDAITARFSKAQGGKESQQQTDELKNILQNQADDRFRLKQEAELLYGELKALPSDEANAKASQIKQANPDLFDKLKSVAEDAKLGLTYNERLMKDLGVDNGERAKFIMAEVQKLKTPEEKNAYIKDLRDKKIVTDKVVEQLRKMKR